MWVLCAMMLNLLQVSTLPSLVFPVSHGSDASSRSYADNNTMDIVVGSVYQAVYDTADRRSRGPLTTGTENTPPEGKFDFTLATEISAPMTSNGSSEDASQMDDIYMTEEREACSRNSLTSCWSYNFMFLVDSFMWSSTVPELSTGRSSDTLTVGPHLVKLPVKINGSLTVLGRSGAWGLGNVYLFLERQLSRYIEGHAILFPAASSWDEALAKQFSTPVVLSSPEADTLDSRESRHKVKKKSILFPLLILFKFFKIKMILLPILLTTLLIKKLLIVTLALAPNLAGFFRVCRPPFGGQFGLAPAGLLQDVTDSRGEFSNMYNTYANPYKDYHGYRARDWARYAESQHQQPSNIPPDYELN